MKVSIIVFSPTGNTLKVGRMLSDRLSERQVEVQLLDITGEGELFRERDFKGYLRDSVREHDVLCVGSPVYAHHINFNVKDLIRALPRPVEGWGAMAVPFVTYGHINSGISLQEAASLLRGTGRTVIAGMKVDSCHCMTRLSKVMTKINEGMPGDEAMPLIEDLADIIVRHEGLVPDEATDVSRELRYQSLGGRLKAHLIFRERFWQRHLYPQVVFDTTRCEKCGLCTKVCPVQRIEMTGDGPRIPKDGPDCVHCGACVYNCPAEAVDFDANWERWNRFIAKAADGRGPIPSNETPRSAVYPRANT